MPVYCNNKGDLKRHDKSKHECVIYSCNQCECVATTKRNLKIHKNSEHEGIRYPCITNDRQQLSGILRNTGNVNMKGSYIPVKHLSFIE